MPLSRPKKCSLKIKNLYTRNGKIEFKEHIIITNK